MIKEEIIRLLENADGTVYRRPQTRTAQAIEEAIKLIEQEPCEDCISRAELLKVIDIWDKFGLDDTNHLFRLDNLSLPYYAPYIHYDDVIKCIKGMPSVQPKTDVLNKIRAEIPKLTCGDNEYLQALVKVADVIKCIDKHKEGESK